MIHVVQRYRNRIVSAHQAAAAGDENLELVDGVKVRKYRVSRPHLDQKSLRALADLPVFHFADEIGAPTPLVRLAPRLADQPPGQCIDTADCLRHTLLLCK